MKNIEQIHKQQSVQTLQARKSHWPLDTDQRLKIMEYFFPEESTRNLNLEQSSCRGCTRVRVAFDLRSNGFYDRALLVAYPSLASLDPRLGRSEYLYTFIPRLFLHQRTCPCTSVHDKSTAVYGGEMDLTVRLASAYTYLTSSDADSRPWTATAHELWSRLRNPALKSSRHLSLLCPIYSSPALLLGSLLFSSSFFP